MINSGVKKFALTAIRKYAHYVVVKKKQISNIAGNVRLRGYANNALKQLLLINIITTSVTNVNSAINNYI
tara:strand:+ start:345 stop:554 length:210 start_codon:yes stop_codon:yes gene_type:complete